MGPERRGRAVHGRLEVNPSGEEPTDRPRQKNAGLWEPYDGRLSRTVLREREGEVPSRYSPGFESAGPQRIHIGFLGPSCSVFWLERAVWTFLGSCRARAVPVGRFPRG